MFYECLNLRYLSSYIKQIQELLYRDKIFKLVPLEIPGYQKTIINDIMSLTFRQPLIFIISTVYPMVQQTFEPIRSGVPISIRTTTVDAPPPFYKLVMIFPFQLPNVLPHQNKSILYLILFDIQIMLEIDIFKHQIFIKKLAKYIMDSKMHNLPFCITHNNQVLNLLELRTDDVRLICVTCLLNLLQTKKNYDASKIVDLVEVYDYPEQTFQFTDLKDKPVLIQFINKQIQKMNMIKQQIESLLKELQQWQQELIQSRTIFQNIIKQDEFKQTFDQLANQEKSINNETILEIQKKFYNYFQSIKVINQEATQKDLENMKGLHNDMAKKILKSRKYQKLFQSIKDVELDYEQTFLSYFWDQPIITIQDNVNRYVKDKKGIYKSQEDGLTFDAIRKAIIGKDNLLWFFKSSNNGCTEFGAFTPYIWQEGSHSGTNNSNPSFLFSKTLNQIYPIIQSKGTCTQYFSSGYILFGGTGNSDQDLRVNPDFKSGYSRLGVGYQAPEGVDTSKYSTHLFRALEPNVIECEIYQIIFE